AWAAQLQPSYAPDVALAGVAAGAAAANVESAGPSIERTFFSFFIAYGGIGYAAAYPELDLDSYLTPRGRAWIPLLRNSSILQAAVAGPRFVRASDLADPNVLELPEWRRRLRENRLGLMVPDAPVLLHHARRDQIVSFSQSAGLREDWRALGAECGCTSPAVALTTSAARSREPQSRSTGSRGGWPGKRGGRDYLPTGWWSPTRRRREPDRRPIATSPAA
ncbi:MAG: lipase family protein, partial [Solirubrobacteraceae bacterium]